MITLPLIVAVLKLSVSHCIHLQELISRLQLLYPQRDQTQVEIYANVDVLDFLIFLKKYIIQLNT